MKKILAKNEIIEVECRRETYCTTRLYLGSVGLKIHECILVLAHLKTVSIAPRSRIYARLDLHLSDEEFEEIFSLFDPDNSGGFLQRFIGHYQKHTQEQWAEIQAIQTFQIHEISGGA